MKKNHCWGGGLHGKKSLGGGGGSAISDHVYMSDMCEFAVNDLQART